MHDLTCCSGSARPWHHAYAAWYDHDRAGHKIRAAVFGWIADRLVRWA